MKGGDKNKSLETVIETIDLLNHESSSESEGEAETAEPEASADATEVSTETEANKEESETKKIFITNENDSNLDNTDDLEEIDATGGGKAGDTKTENEFKTDT